VRARAQDRDAGPVLETAMSSPFADDAALRARAQWNPVKMGKATLFEGGGLLVGLNAFEPGQEHAPHAHAGVDKLYSVVDGSGEFSVGEQVVRLERGGLVFAPAGVAHGVKNLGPGRLLVLAVMGPPPKA
jgi:quercetin dioxygenase-like cupin family protein